MFRAQVPAVIGLVANPPSLILGTTLAAAAFAFLIGGMPLELALLITIMFALLAGAQNSINAWTDIVADKVSWPKRPLSRGAIHPSQAMTLSISLFGAATIVLVSIQVVRFSLVLLLIIAFDIFLRITYSTPPLRLKRYPFVSNLIAGAHAVSFPFAAAVAVGAVPNSIALLLGSILFLQAVATLIVEDFVTMEGDKAIGDKTLPLTLGKTKAALTAAGLFLAALLISLQSFITQTSVVWLLVIAIALLQTWAAVRLRIPSANVLHTYDLAGILVFLTGTILVVGYWAGML